LFTVDDHVLFSDATRQIDVVALLIRHASISAHDTLGRRAEVPLDANGETQAAGLAHRLKNIELAAVFSSPILRALQTAEKIGRERDVPVIIEAALREFEVGNWDGRKFSELDADESWKWFNRFRSGTRPPGGEMMIEVQARVVAFLERVSREYRHRNIAIVSHADVIRSAISQYLGVPLDLSFRMKIEPASISVLHISECGAELTALNDTGSGIGAPPFD
jgi:broad specificity phosphatase PhoE